MRRRFLKFRPTNTTHLHLKADSSPWRQRLIDDGQFSGSPGCPVGFHFGILTLWNFTSDAFLKLVYTGYRCCIRSTSKSSNSLTPHSKIHLQRMRGCTDSQHIWARWKQMENTVPALQTRRQKCDSEVGIRQLCWEPAGASLLLTRGTSCCFCIYQRNSNELTPQATSQTYPLQIHGGRRWN